MSSIRPKLKAETPKAVTAWDTRTGTVVWMTRSGVWSAMASDLAAFVGDEAEARLATAMTQEGVITDPYLTEVSERGAITGRETLRETIRATGPTIAYGKAAMAEIAIAA